MKKTNKSKTFTWAVIFAWVFGLAGVGGVMYMLFTNDDYNGFGGATYDSSYVVNQNDQTLPDSATVSKAATPKDADKAASSSSESATKNAVVTPPAPVQKPVEVAVVKPVEKPVEKPQPKPVPVPVPKAPPVVKPVVKPAPVTVPVVKTEIPKVTKPVAKPAPVKKGPDKVMSDEELKQLVADVLQKADNNGIYAKCVQLHHTSGANNTKAVSQIESYLRSQKYSIAGRETVSTPVKGIKITPGNGCMKVIVGSF